MWSAVGPSATALATAVLLVIPALMELAAAHWNSSYAYAIAQLVPPTTLAARTLAPLLPGVALGVLVAFPLTYGRLRPHKSKRRFRRTTRYRLVRTRGWIAISRETRREVLVPWAQILLGGGVATFVGGMVVTFALSRTASFSIYLTALMASLVMLTVTAIVKDHRTDPTNTMVFSGLALVAVVGVMITVNPFPWATFKPANTAALVTGRLLDTTDTGVWLLTDDGRPAFYTGRLDGLTICHAEIKKRTAPACAP